jgi:hypothetical protein
MMGMEGQRNGAMEMMQWEKGPWVSIYGAGISGKAIHARQGIPEKSNHPTANGKVLRRQRQKSLG